MVISIGILVGRAVLGWILITSGLGKLAAPAELQLALIARGHRPATANRYTVRGLGIVECCLASMLFLSNLWPWAAAVSALLFGCFALVIIRWWRSGKQRSCGCGGVFHAAGATPSHAAGLAALAAIGVAVALSRQSEIPAEWSWLLPSAFVAYLTANAIAFLAIRFARRRQSSEMSRPANPAP